jgi:Fic family protein
VRKAAAIEEPYEQSLFLMAFISYLQAFEDVNKRTARLACNVPLLKSGLAPLSFMEMDKAKYVRGLLSFYELGRIDVLREAYVDGYVKSAHRYDAYMARDQAALALELRRRTDIYRSVASYVRKAVESGASLDIADFAEREFADDEGETKDMLIERVTHIIESLHEGNHIAYGVSRRLFDAYTQIASPGTPKP